MPYATLLVIPVLGRMSDQCEPVRILAMTCFGLLIRLMPLDVRNRSNDDCLQCISRTVDGSVVFRYPLDVNARNKLYCA